MKKITALILICLLLQGCNLPVSTPIETFTPTDAPTANITVAPTELPTELATDVPTEAPTAAPTEPPFTGTEYNLGGVYMVLPPCLATSVTGTLIEAVPYDEMNGPMEYYPANRKITFQGYPLSGKFFTTDDPTGTGGLTIYPVAEFVAMNAIIGNRVTAMQTLLAGQPAMPEQIPLLPVFNAMQAFKAQAEFLTFQNGEGVRYLTEYGQYLPPVNNHDLFYSFQGLSSDGEYWVSVILPVNNPYLQESFDLPNVPPGGFVAPTMGDPTYETEMPIYYANMMNLLNTTPNDQFTPTLDCLDQFIQSLNISD